MPLVAATGRLGLVAPIVLRSLVADHNYKHFARRDAPVWERWIALHAQEYLGVCYDVAVGGLPAPDDEATENERRAWQYQTALKVDAFVIGADRALVIEVRPWATVSALGSALTYAMILDRAQVSPLPLTPAVVCEGMQVDVRWACDKLGVEVFEV